MALQEDDQGTGAGNHSTLKLKMLFPRRTEP